MLRASRLRAIAENLCSKDVLAFLYIFVIKHFTRSDLDVFAGYSYVRENPAASGIDNFSMNGGSASFAYNATLRLSGIDGTLSTYLFVRAYPIATSHELLRSVRCSWALHTSVAITAWHFPIQTILLPWRSEEAWTSKSLTISPLPRCKRII